MDRRQFIKTTSVATAMFSSSTVVKAAEKAVFKLGGIKSKINLVAQKSLQSLLPGAETNMLSFTGHVTKGDSSTIMSQSLGFLGPSFEVRKGDHIEIDFVNKTGEPSIVHWHGLDVPEKQDGHPKHAIPHNQTYNYSFTVNNRAGLYWYHPHPHGRTGYQVYNGLAGLFVVRDQEEDSLNLPSGENEIFLALQDRHFDENNQLIYVRNGHDIMMGKIGNRLIVNGETPKYQNAKTEVYRLRILNAGNALPYILHWSDGSPLNIIGTDGGLLEKRIQKEKILLAPGERLDLLVDFSNKNVGDQIQLLSSSLGGNGEPFAVSGFNITEESSKTYTMPEQLSKIEKISPLEAVNPNNPKSFVLMPKQGIGWTIDGLEYEMDNVRPKETIKEGTTEIWEFDLTQAGMVHPMHVHGSQFQVLERIKGPFSEGLVLDEGWKDTVAVLPGDKVRIIKRFNDYKGDFLIHCRILEHEDHSMMRNFRVL